MLMNFENWTCIRFVLVSASSQLSPNNVYPEKDRVLVLGQQLGLLGD